MFRAIRAWFRVRFMYALIVPEYKGIHWCWTMKEIYEWYEAYPPECAKEFLFRGDSYFEFALK